jgi:aspartyl aminopeptidase
MKDLVNNYRAFLDNGKTERECINQIVIAAEKAGYKDVTKLSTKIKAGDKVYFNHMGKTIALYHIGTENIENGMNILGAHIDSPRLDVKPVPLYESDGLVYLDTHYYGGIKKYQWVTLPLAIHGVVIKKDGTKLDIVIGEDENEVSLSISDILPHLGQEQAKKTMADAIKGEALDILIGLAPKADKNEKDESKKVSGKDLLIKLINEKYGFEEDDFLSAELEVVPAGKSRISGLDASMILGYGHDDRSCAYTSLIALLESTETPERTSLCLLADKEEIGSVGATGMNSNFLENATSEVIDALCGFTELKLKRALRNSKMLSSDVSAAFDPLNPELFDKKNAAQLNYGIAFNKYTGSRGKSGSNDANPEFIAQIRNMLDNKNISYQFAELGKVDQGGGGTIAYMCAKYGMDVIDSGVPVLSMHAPWETIAVYDLECALSTYKEFLKIK